MKTILEIQKLDGQIKLLEREVDRSPASIDFKNYKRVLQEGKSRFEQLEKKANEVIKAYNLSLSRYSKAKGNSEILKKRNADNISLENVSALISDSNSLVGELSEDNRQMEELVRTAEDVVRRSAELSNKLTEIKLRAGTIKARIEAKKKEVAPKIAAVQKKIDELEPKVKDLDKLAKYKELKANGIFPVYVGLEDHFCGGCKVELSLNFVEKLKTNKMLVCEHCGRIIML